MNTCAQAVGPIQSVASNHVSHHQRCVRVRKLTVRSDRTVTSRTGYKTDRCKVGLAINLIVLQTDWYPDGLAPNCFGRPVGLVTVVQ